MRALHLAWGATALVVMMSAQPSPAGAVCSVFGGVLSCYPTVCSVFNPHSCMPTVCSPFSRRPCTPYFPAPLGQGVRFTVLSAADNPEQAVAPKGPLNTLLDVRDAITGCWRWPSLPDIHSSMDL